MRGKNYINLRIFYAFHPLGLGVMRRSTDYIRVVDPYPLPPAGEGFISST